METPNIIEVLSDLSASNWLKNALRTSCGRDAVDVCHDAELLARILRNQMVAITPHEEIQPKCAQRKLAEARLLLHQCRDALEDCYTVIHEGEGVELATESKARKAIDELNKFLGGK